MIKNIFEKLLLLIIVLSAALHIYAQNNASKSSDIEALIRSKQFSFAPQIVIPMQGRSRQVDNTFSLTIKNDTLISALPYFGRAYSVPADPSKNALDFTSVNYTYDIKEGKKNKMITIKTKDQAENITYNLTVYDNGNATLNMLSNNRQSISYNGTVIATDK